MSTGTHRSRAEALRQRYLAYAAKFHAETAGAEPPETKPPTDENLMRHLSHPGLVRPLRVEECDVVREALAEFQ